MDQKKFNERIAMSLLRQCAWVWEHCTKSPNDGEFTLTQVLQGLGRNAHKSHPGYVIIDADLCKYWDVFNVQQPIDGLTFDRKAKTSKLFFETADGMGFGCSFPIESVYEVTRDFCSGNACQHLVSKTRFIHHGKERYASLPDIRPSTQKPAAKPRKPAVKAEPKKELSLAEQLRAALLKRLAA